MLALQLDVTIARGRQCVSLRGELGHGGLAVAEAVPGEAAALARAIAVETPPGGRVKVGGADVAGNEPDDRRVGYVPAGGQLLPQLTLRRNIEYGLRRRITAERFVESRVEQASERLDLGLVLDLHPHEVTPDERLRAAVARAAVRLPQVLVLDLPDARVDDGTGGPVDPADLRGLAEAASLSDRFGLAMVVLSADPAALDQVEEPWRIARRACDEAAGGPAPAVNGGMPDPGGPHGEGGAEAGGPPAGGGATPGGRQGGGASADGGSLAGGVHGDGDPPAGGVHGDGDPSAGGVHGDGDPLAGRVPHALGGTTADVPPLGGGGTGPVRC